MILTPLQKLPNNVGDLGKIIVATSFEWLPKVKKISRSGHTGDRPLPHLNAKEKHSSSLGRFISHLKKNKTIR